MDANSKDETAQLAAFLSQLTYDQLPVKVVDHAKLCILNALGCALGSCDCEPRLKAIKALQPTKPLEDDSTSTILGRAERSNVQTAAFLNGIAFTAADYDDTHLRTVIHPSATPLAALLPVSETLRLQGRDLILAFVAGVETQCAVGNAISPSHYKDGWHITGTTGTFGAAAAIAKLLCLSPDQFSAGLGHAASMASGIRAMFGSDTKTLHAGRGAQNGILAGLLAQEGFSSCNEAIEAWASLVSSTVDTAAVSAISRGGPWQILENTFKPYPCGIVIHPLIDGCLELYSIFTTIERHGTDTTHLGPHSLSDIENVEVIVNPQCVRLCNVRHPRTELETIFSLYHGCAVALVYGKAGPVEFKNGLEDAVVASVRDLIEVRVDDQLRDDQAWLRFWSRSRPGIALKTRSIHIEHATGSLARPMTKQQVEGKFIDQAVGCIGLERAQKAMDACSRLDAIEDVSSFVKLFAK